MSNPRRNNNFGASQQQHQQWRANNSNRTVRHGNNSNFFHQSNSSADANWRQSSRPPLSSAAVAVNDNYQAVPQRSFIGNIRNQPPNNVDYCSFPMAKCQDAACHKVHTPSEFDIAFQQNRQLSYKMKMNISKALWQIDKDLKKARQDFAAATGAESKKEHEIRVFELVAQRHAFCARAYEALYLKHLNRVAFTSVTWRELFRINGRLPALAKRLELEAAIRSNQVVMVVGSTGSGKSTQIPQYILDMPEFFGKKVYCTQPRRVATVSLAERVAYEYVGGYEPLARVGGVVGFQIGGFSKRSSRTNIYYMTEGMLVQHLAEKFTSSEAKKGDDEEGGKHRIALDKCAAVVVDEVHERNVLSDFLLGLLKSKRKSYPALKVIISSATIDNQKFQNYFGKCPIVEIPGRAFHVKIEYEPHTMYCLFAEYREMLISATVTKTLELVNTTPSGDILIFLTGQGEVENARDRLRQLLLDIRPDKRAAIKVFALFGKQTPDEQRSIVGPLAGGLRKIIFATDVAETSITIDGIRYVVDCGYTKDVAYDSANNVSSLKVVAISKSSADQRAGRAGRTGPGVCYRLYSKETYEKMEPFPKPEIQRKSLALTVVTLVAIGQNPYNFDWIDPPEKAAILASENELRFIGSIEGPIENAYVTEVGRAISCLQIDPCLGRMIYFACRKGFGEAATIIASLLTSGFTMFPQKTTRSKYLSDKGDIVSAYRAYCDWLPLKKEADEEAKLAQELEEKSAINNPAVVGAENNETGKGDDAKIQQEQSRLQPSTTSGKDDKEASSINSDSGDHGAAEAGSNKPSEDVNEDDQVMYESDGEEENLSKRFEMLLPDEMDEIVDLLDLMDSPDTIPTTPKIEQWVVENGVSSDACYMASLEHSSLMGRLQARGFWKMSETQNRQPSDEELQKMVLTASLMNVSKLQSVSRQRSIYRVLRTDINGEIARGSVYKLMPGSSVPPKWIVYHEATQGDANKSALLRHITAIDPSWVDSQFPLDCRRLVEKNLP